MADDKMTKAEVLEKVQGAYGALDDLEADLKSGIHKIQSLLEEIPDDAKDIADDEATDPEVPE